MSLLNCIGVLDYAGYLALNRKVINGLKNSENENNVTERGLLMTV